jgi:hypothetical protein
MCLKLKKLKFFSFSLTFPVINYRKLELLLKFCLLIYRNRVPYLHKGNSEKDIEFYNCTVVEVDFSVFSMSILGQNC